MLVVDNLSPFTADILTCLGQLDNPHLHKRFSEVSNEELAQCNRVILSGRRKHSKEINAVNSRIIRYCHYHKKPLLGICYGAEIIALTLGGSIRKMPVHVQGTTEVSVSSANPLTEGKKSILVYESHRYCIAKSPQILARLQALGTASMRYSPMTARYTVHSFTRKRAEATA